MTSSYRADIEGLRGVAILSVVLYHAHVVPGGFVGVDVFFALSGYLITGLLVDEIRRDGRIDFVNFYSRRARRLLPAAALTTTVTIVVAWLLLAPLEQRTFTGTAAAGTLYATNVWFAHNATDYLSAPPDSNPFLHYWSLAVEEQFYLVWPLVVIAAWRWRRPALLVAAIVVASFALACGLMSTASPWAFFGPHARAWEFGLGALASLVAVEPRPSIRGLLAWTGFAAVLVAVFAYNPTTPFPGMAAVLPVGGTVLILAMKDAHLTRQLSRIQTLGKVSYGWYLWHWPAIVFATTLVPGLSPLGRLAAAALALLLAAIARALVEDPIRFSPAIASRPQLTLALAAALTIASLVGVRAWRHAVVLDAAEPDQIRFLAARDDHPAIYANGCHVDIARSRPTTCSFGDPGASTTVALFGDSHAAQWFPALDVIAKAKRWRLVLATKSGCPAADLAVYPACDAWRRQVLARLRELRPDLIILANADAYLREAAVAGRFQPATFVIRSGPSAIGRDDWSAGMRRTLAALSPIRIAILTDVPQPGFDVPMCLARSSWHPWLRSACEFAPASAVGPDLARPGIRVVSMSDVICPDAACETTPRAIVDYRDDNHLTARFSATLAPALMARLDALDWTNP